MDTSSLQCQDLAQFFDAHPRPNNFAELIDQPSGQFRCEMQRVSRYSTGRPVLLEEVLVRVIISPRDLEKPPSMELGESCISDVSRLGLSVLRRDFNERTQQEIEALARFLVDRAADNLPDDVVAECYGALEIPCSTIRGEPGPNGAPRAYGAYESPEEGRQSHADVLQAVSLYPSKTKAKTAAWNFLEKIRGRFFPANLYPYANISGISMRGRRPKA